MVALPTALPVVSTLVQDRNTGQYLSLLQSGEKPLKRPDCGRWLHLVKIVENTYDQDTRQAGHVSSLLQSLIKSKKYPGLAELLSFSSSDVPSTSNTPLLVEVEHPSSSSSSSYPQLPDSVTLSPSLSVGACPWLDEYISYSKLVSPEGYEDFHEACGLWLLSTIAGRRVKIPFRKKQYTPLMILLVADSTLYAKSETVDVGVMVLQSAGLRWLLGSDRTTPSKLLTDMVGGTVSKNYDEMDEDKQYYVRQRLAMSAQRGWRYDEFGELVRAITKGGGTMEDLKGLLLQLDACSDQYEYSTQSRGTELIEKPYLSLLGCMTPPDIRNSAKSGSDFWSDGFWARFVFITPPPNTSKDIPFDIGEIPVPYTLSNALRNWHERLGTPSLTLEAKEDERKKFTGYKITRGELPETEVSFGEGVHDAWKAYRSALKQIATSADYADFRASYGRLPIKAIRVAALFASLDASNQIELRHWALAQTIAERWRRSLHELYAQVNTSLDEPTFAKRIEQDILKYVRKLEDKQPPTVRDLSRYMTTVDVSRIKTSVLDLVKTGLLVEDRSGKSPRYTSGKEE